MIVVFFCAFILFFKPNKFVHFTWKRGFSKHTLFGQKFVLIWLNKGHINLLLEGEWTAH